MNDRVVKQDTLKGVFGLPIGVTFLSRETGDYPKSVVVSTVCLDRGHLEDPLGITEAETGFETMVFLEGCTFFSIFTQRYKTRAEARRGHRTVVKKIIDQKLTLAIPMAYYNAWEIAEPVAA